MTSSAQLPNDASPATRPTPRVLAFYLPQFHPIPENDVFWGTGHTEWTYVVQAKPRFPAHYQPRIPADLGFYDLRLPEVRQAQADLAKEYGIHGFCYYHYWFKGRRLLERPFDEVLESGRPDFPFCLCWANHSWNWRRGDKERQGRLIAQAYSEEDDREHIRWLLDVFQDERYIKVNGRPLFLIYRVFDMPDPLRTLTMWKEEAHKRGMAKPYICKADSHGNFGDPREYGCDAAAEFWPHHLETLITRAKGSEDFYRVNKIQEYRDVVAALLKRPAPPWRRFPCVLPDRDNTPRAEYGGEDATAHIFRGSTPELYERWLEGAIQKTLSNPPEEQLVFINAWNEWSEGSYLEPDVKYGRAYLEATRRALHAAGAEVPTGVATGNGRAKESIPDPSPNEKLYRNLLDKYALLQHQFMELLSAEEHSPLMQKTDQRIEELQRENRQLKRQHRKLEHSPRDVERLTRWMQQLDAGISALLKSQRWKLGNALGEASQRVLLKPRVPTPQDHLVKILGEFRAWLKYSNQDSGGEGERTRQSIK